MIGRRACLRLILYTHVDAPRSINSKRITAKPAREGFVNMCACTEPVRTGIGAVCVEYGRPKWPMTMLNHTHNHAKHTMTQRHTQTSLVQQMFCFSFLAPDSRATRYEEAFLPKGQKRPRSLRSLGLASILKIWRWPKQGAPCRNMAKAR